jgi:hypothetical protein
MVSMPDFATFDDFFPYYMRQHSKPATRWFHFAGTHLGAAAGVAGVVRREPLLVAAAPVLSRIAAEAGRLTLHDSAAA